MTRPCRALVVGYGSIGARHAGILDRLGLEVAVVSRRPHADMQRFAGIEEALDGFEPDYVIIAVETDRHHEAVARLAAAGFTGRVLVEKPMFAAAADLPDHRFAVLAVGYQLRFHPAVEALRARLDGEEPMMALFEAGQHLSAWRPGRDWRSGYSAGSAGGGVLRDLSHELDLMMWLFGPWRRLAALGGNTGSLDIAADDVGAFLVETARCPVVSISLDYLARPGRRRIAVETRRHSFVVDLVAGTFAVDGESQSFATERDAPFVAMHEAMLAGEAPASCCTAEQGLAVIEMIVAVERAVARRAWIEPS